MNQALNPFHHFCCPSLAVYSFLAAVLHTKLIKEDIKYLDTSYISQIVPVAFVVLF